MKVDTFELFVTVVAVDVDESGKEVEMEAATFSTDDNCGFVCAADKDEDDEFVATINDDDENEPLISFSLDVVSLFEFEDEMILFCRFLVILANCM